MLKVSQMIAVASVVLFTVCVQAGLHLDVDVRLNTTGDDLYVITATSDVGLITSLGVHVASEGGYLGQYHTVTHPSTPFGPPPCLIEPWYCGFDDDTYAMFDPTEVIYVPGFVDTVELLEVSFTGFEPFASRDVVQVVLSGGEAVATIHAVVDGVMYSAVAEKEGQKSALVPEPGCVMMVAAGGLLMLKRRK